MVANLGQVVLVKDIFSGIQNSNSSNFTLLNNKLYFAANDSVSGRELWVSDGTTNGTRLVKDINLGSYDENFPKSSAPFSFTIFNNKLYFSANDGVNGRELWVSDSTTNGTQLLKDIFPGSTTYYNNFTQINSSYPGNLTVLNNKLYFDANDGVNGRELWISDGTEDGTQLLKDIAAPDNTYANLYGINGTAILNDKLYFTANDGVNGRELWVSDGTEDGTQLLKDISSGFRSAFPFSYPVKLTVFNSQLYFSANDGVSGKELWVSDGTEDGTQLLKDINPGVDPSNNSPYGSYPDYMAGFNNKIYFVADDGVNGRELWVSDGTEDGTQLLKDINLGSGNSDAGSFAIFSNQLYFTANNGVNGNELWISDGTSGGTQLFKDINPGSGNSNAGNFAIFNNKIYFTANNGVNGNELWVSDGTTNGTQLVADINSGSSSSNASNLTVVGNELLFTANNGTTGVELFKLTFDGSTTIAGTNGADNLNGTVNPDRIEGLGGNDTIFGESGNDTLLGGNGNDNLVGGAGNDSILGGSGSDTLSGGIGNDTLNGGTGFDILTGGTGNGIFVIRTNNGGDSIVDFKRGSDKLGLAGELEFEDLNLTGNTVKSGNELLATLIGVNTGNLTEVNFTTV